MPRKKSRVVITGGAGFVGSHLCRRFLREGFYVIAVDCLDTGRKENVVDLVDDKNFEFIEHDIIIPLNLRADLILNFACPASPVHYQRDPIWTAKTCFLGTMNMLGLAKKNRARMIHASTSEIYGDPKEHPQKETYWGNVNTIGIRSCYDEGKRIGETLCFDYMRRHQVDVGVIRIFNTYGPHMSLDDGRVVSNFIAQALQGKPLTVYGEGQQTRSFCYVDDLVEGILRFSLLKGASGPINLGNDHEFTIMELASEVLHQTKSSSPIEFRPLPSDDPKTRRPDLIRAKALLDWEPRIQLREGIEKSIPYFRKEISKFNN